MERSVDVLVEGFADDSSQRFRRRVLDDGSESTRKRWTEALFKSSRGEERCGELKVGLTGKRC